MSIVERWEVAWESWRWKKRGFRRGRKSWWWLGVVDVVTYLRLDRCCGSHWQLHAAWKSHFGS